jgi:hypothetical protein
VADHVKSFTSWKLDLLQCLAADPRIRRMVFEFAFCILQHMNSKTLQAFVSDETVRDKTGICERDAYRARQVLKATGWLDWRRTRTANIYTFSDKNVNTTFDLLELKKEARQDRREKKRRGCVLTQESEQKGGDMTQESDHVRTLESDIHLTSTPYRISASKVEAV